MNHTGPGDVGYWDRRAVDFDVEPDHGLGSPALRSAWLALLEPLIPTGSEVLDVGCGTGSLSVLLASDGSRRVVGVDWSPEMIRVARLKARRAGVSLEFVVGDATTPVEDSGTFDVVVGRHIVWALTDRETAISSWRNLLRPGGRLVLVEGRWKTGAGLTEDQLARTVRRFFPRVRTAPLDDEALWGGAITDERYVLIAER